ncbi:hypothetical protein PC9H_000153 [Pleurotus ostreatus]|uniref:Uncharacterized protein n=1 Tax=Pleurotus ostreatus TaxID=5322 RepID=A0A8H7A469_PLEOS|nr:uncharacterized protein PC9H_000153 [Pleurotus ostreatus]KAF7439817.1 hypothetical protein PC9H_000153 [Pleurotus ostreatus]KAJ8701010.1 hypothetical protein PTI98_003978 [Pleurotus ostreatus]
MPNLQPPAPPRRMTMPSSSPRPPSPLRNGFVYDTSTGIDPDVQSDSGSEDDGSDDSDGYHRPRGGRRGSRSPSPSASVTQLAANLAHRVGSLVSSTMTPRSPSASSAQLQFPNPPSHHPGLSAAEIESEAERERDRTRREAERILTAEAEERKRVEERVLALLHKTNATNTLPPPPARSQTLPPSPTPSQKEGLGGWWQAAKNKLTPTKEPLTPAQQVIQEAKSREKEERKRAKEREKEGGGYSSESKGKEREWPTNPNTKYSDPILLKLNTPQIPRKPPPQAPSPSSPTPSRGMFGSSPQPTSDALLPPLSASPKLMSPSTSPRPHASPSVPSLSSNLASPNLLASPANKTSAANSPTSRQPTPLPIYATFTPSGTLDVPSTVLAIARRFEKLERWTVGHVRALEERMGDVEAWLVEKENAKEAEQKEKEQANGSNQPNGGDQSKVQEEMNGVREELGELQSRFSMLGREVAKLAMAMPSDMDSPPRPPPQQRQPPPVAAASPQPSEPPMLPDFTLGTLGDLSLTPSRGEKRDSQWGDLPISSVPSKMPVQVRDTPRKASEQGIVSESEDEFGDQVSVDAPSTSRSLERQTEEASASRDVREAATREEQAIKEEEAILDLGVGMSPMTSPLATPHRRVPSLTARESTSPPLASRTTRGAAISKRASGTRLPYPSGDYAPLPPGTELAVSPSSTGATSPDPDRRNSAISGLPSMPSSPPFGAPTRVLSPGPMPGSRTNVKIGNLNRPLPAPTASSQSQRLVSPRPSPSPSVSPTPRKRYTVALGEPITRGSAMLSESDNDANEGGSEAESEDDTFADETIGKKGSARIASSLLKDASSSTASLNSLPPESGFPPATGLTRQKHVSPRSNDFSSNASQGHKPRAQSIYGLSSVYQTAPPKPVAPLNPGRLRSSRSTDKFAGNGSGPEGKFVDPLLLRRQEKAKTKEIAMPKPIGKVPIGDLVAFFDKS